MIRACDNINSTLLAQFMNHNLVKNHVIFISLLPHTPSTHETCTSPRCTGRQPSLPRPRGSSSLRVQTRLLSMPRGRQDGSHVSLQKLHKRRPIVKPELFLEEPKQNRTNTSRKEATNDVQRPGSNSDGRLPKPSCPWKNQNKPK